MNIKQLLDPPMPAPVQFGAMIVDYKHQAVSATEGILDQEAYILARAAEIQQVTDADENRLATEAQTSLALYIRRVRAAEEAAKSPINSLRTKIIALSKELIARADAEGNRLGALTSEFQIAENNRVAALRRLQDETAHVLEKERDQKLSQAPSSDAQDQIKDEYRQAIADAAPPVEPVRAPGQVVRSDWEVIVHDVHMLYRAHPNCVKLTPLLSEIKALLDMGVVVKGVKAEKVVKAGVRLGKEPSPIEI